MRELSLHLLDLLENARKAGATEVQVEITEDSAQDRLEMAVTDNGCGLPEGALERAFDPYFTTRTTRRVGLGLPLLQAAAERTGGSVQVKSVPGCTVVRASFGLSHIDRAPMGDVVGTLVGFMLSEPMPRLVYRHRVDDSEFEFDSSVAAGEVGGCLTTTDVSRWVREYLTRSVEVLRRGMS
ncbi:MAG: ATP-binding protein [Anaerolineae bacterium]